MTTRSRNEQETGYETRLQPRSDDQKSGRSIGNSAGNARGMLGSDEGVVACPLRWTVLAKIVVLF